MSSANGSSSDMPAVDPARAADLAANLARVVGSMKAANTASRPVRLIAVSKLKPASDVLALHQHGHSHFGENYLQELQQKAALLPQSIHWSFIGALQTNKCAPLAKIPNLWSVNGVDSAKKVDALQKGRREYLDSQAASKENQNPMDATRLRVFVQVNTSGEDSKSGVPPGSEVVALCRHVRAQNGLRLQGLMTIGAIARSQASGSGHGDENEDFVTLRRERDHVADELGMEAEELELSMGMSADFEEAIQMGSAEVRVGSTIFGERPPKDQATV